MAAVDVYEQQAKSAVEGHDIEAFSMLLHGLRFNQRKNYEEIAELFEEWTGIDRAEFELLCQEADDAEARS